MRASQKLNKNNEVENVFISEIKMRNGKNASRFVGFPIDFETLPKISTKAQEFVTFEFSWNVWLRFLCCLNFEKYFFVFSSLFKFLPLKYKYQEFVFPSTLIFHEVPYFEVN